jgi:mannan endo-1,4-beta-mannosidase
VLSRNDSSINFNWAHGSPSQVVTNDHFSAQWVGQQYYNTGTHLFTISHDDGARVYVDGVLVYNHWSNQSASNRTFSVNIRVGGVHELKVEYFENSGNASIHLSSQ